ncbi:MAG: YdcF family protein [Candidatus Uhrbacteria bacterium]|nr:YdcF family protein [Candidatus Uhrbacteria bacterium]
MNITKERVDELAKKIWEYMLVHQQLKKADCILVMGSYDRRVGQYAVDLFLRGYAPLIIFSGGGSRKESSERFGKSEAETFADIARHAGVPEESIMVESRAANTTENVLFTKKLLEERGVSVRTVIIVQKPAMERRAFATFRQRWPEKECVVTSPPISYEDFPNEEIPKDLMIQNIVGDLQRIRVYTEKGWLIPQKIPDEVWSAYEELVGAGYTQRLLKEI